MYNWQSITVRENPSEYEELKILCSIFSLSRYIQGFSYLSEIGARGLLNLEFGGEQHLDHQNRENLMQSKRTELPF